jgi:peptide/nickel transport system permease protein
MRERIEMANLSLQEASATRRALAWPQLPLAISLAVAWVVAMLVIALLADVISPYGYATVDLRHRLAAPGNSPHWLGTDELGRDVLSRLFLSIRISLLIAFGATVISAVVGTLLGFLAAYFRKLVEQLVLMLADFQASMPFLILALAACWRSSAARCRSWFA